jgi:hypothetical protein
MVVSWPLGWVNGSPRSVASAQCASWMLDGEGEITMEADRVVQTGSFKIAVCLEVYCQAVSGEIAISRSGGLPRRAAG